MIALSQKSTYTSELYFNKNVDTSIFFSNQFCLRNILQFFAQEVEYPETSYTLFALKEDTQNSRVTNIVDIVGYSLEPG